MKIVEKGRIIEIKGNTVAVKADMGAACFGCMNQECRAGKGITAENPKALPLQPGQVVEVSAPGIPLLAQALVVLLPPVLGFIAGYAGMRLLFPQTGEAAHAAVGALSLFIAAFIVYFVRRRRPAAKVYVVTKIIG
jgi:sigma-E factor negative regulatory protein RseC